MNRRNFLLKGMAALALPAIAEPFQPLLLDGTGDYATVICDDRYLFGGDWTLDMWIRRPSEENTVVSDLTLTFDLPAGKVLDWDSVRVVIQKHEKEVPVDSDWHHLCAHGGRFFVDGVEERPLVITDESVAETA
jgi:hypothetical protein